ncbi:MAG: GTP cyclohydrolase II [Deltaproteobacteria bacterium]|nr:GTP cyclohydrolase II [Deltaproteobacteria bacterium]
MSPLVRYAEAQIPTAHGSFRIVVYRNGGDEHLALVRGDVAGGGVLARVHSECFTGEVIGSLKCDCREQLDSAIQAIAAAERGVLVYLRQEGRGIGLGNKIRAYALQAEGKDTVEANLALGFAADLRSYEVAAAILTDLGVTSVALMTNNPDKLRGLEKAGVAISQHVPHWIPDHEHNKDYLEVKRAKLGHLDQAKSAKSRENE